MICLFGKVYRPHATGLRTRMTTTNAWRWTNALIAALMILGLDNAVATSQEPTAPPLNAQPGQPRALPATGSDPGWQVEPPVANPAPWAHPAPSCCACQGGDQSPCCRCDCPCCGAGCGGFDFSKVPPVRTFPRLGYFFIAPSGPGYYSLHDVWINQWRDKPPHYPLPPAASIAWPNFEADYRYLDAPDNKQHDIFDPLHRNRVGHNWLFSTGGQVTTRYVHEVNSRLSGLTNDFQLLRTRVYGDLWYQDSVRAYVELLDLHSFHPDLPPTLSDVNRSDLLDAFVEVKLCEIDCRPAYVRVGRQELSGFGSQRLINDQDWSLVRRNFEGVRGFHSAENWDFDLFWVQPVIPDPSNFDSADHNQNFAGAWYTYRPAKGQYRDLYYLMLDNDSTITDLTGPAAVTRAPFTVHTLGGRIAGDKNNFLYDFEAMVQFGERGDQEICAGSVTAGGGYAFTRQPLSPQVWVYYDYASGDRSPNGGEDYSTFNQLFNFGHHYFGYIDQVGRQNIHDFNVHLGLFPAKWIAVYSGYHHFRLDSAVDALYNSGGVAIRRDPTGSAGRDVGDEIDFAVNFHLGPHSDLYCGYSKLYYGDFLRRTSSGRASELAYVWYSFRW
jgi:hypothetical protein